METGFPWSCRLNWREKEEIQRASSQAKERGRVKIRALPEVINRKSLGKKEETKIITFLINGGSTKTLTTTALKCHIAVSVEVPGDNKGHAQIEQFSCLNTRATVFCCV